MKENKTYNLLRGIFGGLVIAAVIFRVITLLKIYDYETGFFTNHSNPIVYIFYICCIAGALGLTITEFIFYGKAPHYAGYNQGIAGGLSDLILAAIIFYSSFPGIKEFFNVKILTGGNLKAISEQMGGPVNIILPATGIVSSLVLIILAAKAISGKNIKIPVLTLFPVFWAVWNVVSTFSVTASYIKQSELFVELFAYVFAMTAFLGFARHIWELGLKNSSFYFIPTSFCCCAFCLMAVIYCLSSGRISYCVNFFGLLIFFTMNIIIAIKNNKKNTENTTDE